MPDPATPFGIADRWVLPAEAGLRIVLVVILCAAALAVANRLIRFLRRRLAKSVEDPEEIKRIVTVARVLRYVASVAILLIGGLLVLGELGVSVAPILGAAGVVGVAVGFGAQNLIKDYFNGFFLLVENQLRQGDVVEAGGKAGFVEEVTLRYVRMRDYDGNVHFVPNGTITTVTNMSREFAHAVIDAGVAYKEDVDRALEVMRRTGAELRADADFAARILEDIEIVGVERWDDSAVVLRCRFKVMPLEQWNVRREYLRRLKKAFDQEGIEIPFPHVKVVGPGIAPVVPRPPTERRRAVH